MSENLIGRRFGRLTVMAFDGIHKSPCGTTRRMWRCKCDCGNETVVNTSNLFNGSTKSCGCWKLEKITSHNTKHNGTHDRLYMIWKSMKYRCSSDHDKRYEVYGGKGVSVCQEWLEDYDAFKRWAYENGYDESAKTGECTIDRIDNNGNYEPSNCRWVDRTVQANNTSRNHWVELNGFKMTIAEFAKVMNISKNHAWYYLNKFEREVTDERQFDITPGCDKSNR